MFGLTAESGVGSQTGLFYSPGDATQTELVDVSFTAMTLGLDTFTLTTVGNGLQGNEWNADGATYSAATVDPTAQTSSFAVDIVAVPEPASIGLIGIGSFGLLARRRRRTVG